MDIYNMTKDEFNKYSKTRQFTDQPTEEQFDIVWQRLNPHERRNLIEIIRNNSLQVIIESIEIKNKIFQIFNESLYITTDIEIIVKQIKDFDDGTPLNLIG